MIPVLVVIVLAAIAVFYVVRPLTGTAEPSGHSPESDAAARKLRALEAIVDLEGDLAGGKISHDDFETFKAGYAHEALAAMRELDVAAQGAHDVDLESEIAAARARLR